MDKYEKTRKFIESGKVDHLATSVANLAKKLTDYQTQIENARRFGLGPNLLAVDLLPHLYSEIRSLQRQVDQIEEKGRELMLETDQRVE